MSVKKGKFFAPQVSSVKVLHQDEHSPDTRKGLSLRVEDGSAGGNYND